MVIAWIGFASVGIFMARYMKGAFDEKELLGTKIWFTVRGLRIFLMFQITRQKVLILMSVCRKTLV